MVPDRLVRSGRFTAAAILKFVFDTKLLLLAIVAGPLLALISLIAFVNGEFRQGFFALLAAAGVGLFLLVGGYASAWAEEELA